MEPVGCDRWLLDLNVDMEYLSARKGGLYVQQEVVRDVRNQTGSHSNPLSALLVEDVIYFKTRCLFKRHRVRERRRSLSPPGRRRR
jgi:hypothetical protein